MCAADWEHRSLSVVPRFGIFFLFLTETDEDEEEVKGKMGKENEEMNKEKSQKVGETEVYLRFRFWE